MKKEEGYRLENENVAKKTKQKSNYVKYQPNTVCMYHPSSTYSRTVEQELRDEIRTPVNTHHTYGYIDATVDYMNGYIDKGKLEAKGKHWLHDQEKLPAI
jgi:hypothetical protein